MAKLIAFVKAQSRALITEIHDAWEAGDSVAVLDPTLPKQYLADLIDTIDPDVIQYSGDVSEFRMRNYDLVADAALVICTSGTSGKAKAVVHTHQALQASAAATGSYLSITPGVGTWICALPITHIGGFTTITKAMYQKVGLEIFEHFDYLAIQEIAKAGPSYLPIVRAHLSRIDPSLFTRLVLGAGVAPTELPKNAHVTYGLTETGSGVVYDGWALEKVNLAISPQGEILIQGPMLASCYRDTTPIIDSHGWFHSDDAGEIIDNRLTVFGRRSEIIHSGGEMIVPSRIEEVLRRLPGIDEIAVVGVNDLEFGQLAWAFVVVRQGSQDPTLAELKDAIRAVLPHYYAPRGLEIVKSLPKTPLGKIQKKRLSQIFEAERKDH